MLQTWYIKSSRRTAEIGKDIVLTWYVSHFAMIHHTVCAIKRVKTKIILLISLETIMPSLTSCLCLNLQCSIKDFVFKWKYFQEEEQLLASSSWDECRHVDELLISLIFLSVFSKQMKLLIAGRREQFEEKFTGTRFCFVLQTGQWKNRT